MARDSWVTSTDQELFDRAAELRLGDGDEQWECADVITELQRRGTVSVYEIAVGLLTDRNPAARMVACDVLGQLGWADGKPFGTQSLLHLLGRTTEANRHVLGAAITALGHLGATNAVPAVLAHEICNDEQVRFSLACALPNMVHADAGEDDAGVQALMRLTTDESAEVRDWATFGLGTQLRVDGDAVRDCLRARLEDGDADTRCEALKGLRQRNDAETIQHLTAALRRTTAAPQEVELAYEWGDPDLLGALENMQAWWTIDPALLRDAVDACRTPAT